MSTWKLEAEIVDFVRMEGGYWDEDDDEIQLYELINEKVEYTDLEKGYQTVNVRIKRIEDGKIFDFTAHKSPYHSSGDIYGKYLTGTEYIPKPKVKKEKAITVTFTGFDNIEQAKEFASWYSGQGEQDSCIWLEEHAGITGAYTTNIEQEERNINVQLQIKKL